MAVPLAIAAVSCSPPPRPSRDDIPIMLTVHLLGLVAGMAMIIGLIPAAIALLIAGGWS